MALIALIAPYRVDRMLARTLAVQSGCQFLEVFVDASLAVCEQRDPKDLYRRARAGEIRGFTGIDAPYEAPENPDIRVPTGELGIEQCVALITESRFCSLMTALLPKGSKGLLSSRSDASQIKMIVSFIF